MKGYIKLDVLSIFIIIFFIAIFLFRQTPSLAQSSNLELEYSDINFSHACSYYKLDYSGTLINWMYDMVTLNISKITEVHGKFKGNTSWTNWEWRINTTYNETVPNCSSICNPYNVTNATDVITIPNCSETCNPYTVIAWKWDWIQNIPTNLNTYGSKLYTQTVSSGYTKVRFCADFQRELTSEGWKITLDHIPKFANVEYPFYTWWNNTATGPTLDAYITGGSYHWTGLYLIPKTNITINTVKLTATAVASTCTIRNASSGTVVDSVNVSGSNICTFTKANLTVGTNYWVYDNWSTRMDYTNTVSFPYEFLDFNITGYSASQTDTDWASKTPSATSWQGSIIQINSSNYTSDEGTPTYNYTSVTLYLNSTTTNITSMYPNATINVTAISNVSDLYVPIWRNGILIANATSSSFNISLTGAGYWNYTAIVEGNVTYNTSSPISLWFNISKGESSTTLLLNESSINKNYWVSDFANFTVISNVTGLTVNISTNISGWYMPTGTTTLINLTNMTTAGIFNITGIVVGTENYTGSSETHYANVSDTSTPVVSLINWNTTGGFTDNTLSFNQIIDFIKATVTDADLYPTSVTIDVYDPDSTKVVNAQAMTNVSSVYTYGTDFTLNKAGVWSFNISATNGYKTGTCSTIVTVNTNTLSLKDGWYGYAGNKILGSAEISSLTSYGYDIFELEENITNITRSWTDMKNSINDSINQNVRIGINYKLDYDLNNTTKTSEYMQNITAHFPDLTASPYADGIEYISLELVNTSTFNNSIKTSTLNDLAENITDAINNQFVVYSKNYNTSLDNSYIAYTIMIYIAPSSGADFINVQRQLFENTTSLNRMYIVQTDALKPIIQTFHTNIIDKLRSIPNTTSIGEDNATFLQNGNVILFNNDSVTKTFIINVSEIAGKNGKDAWDSTAGKIIEMDSDLNFSVSVNGFNGTIVYLEDLDHIQIDENSIGNLYKATTSTTEIFGYTNETMTNNWGLYGANDFQVELFDPHYIKNNFIVYYGWLNSSYIKSPQGWENYEIVIIADTNNAELDKLNYTATEFYGYISVADYNNSDAWLTSKTNEVDNWLGANDSLNLFIDGLDTGIGGTNFSVRMKVLIDYVQVTKGRKAILNTYTAYEDFATWGTGGVMKESCVNRWNGADTGNPDNYTRENWSLELQKSVWYQNHNVKVLCQAFDNRSVDNSYTIENYTELQSIYFASKVLGYDYFYLSQPDFNYAHLEYIYDTGNDLDRTYHQHAVDNNTYYRTYENGIVYYNTTSKYGWIDDERVINNAEVCFYLYDAHANTVTLQFEINKRSPTGTTGTYSINDGWGVGTWSWRCVNITTPPTNGRYLIEAWVNPRGTTPGQGLNIGNELWAEQNTGKHSWYDSSATDSWIVYDMDKNWMVNVSVNETKKTSIDVTEETTQTVTTGVSHRNITLTSTSSMPIEVWSYPLTIGNAFTSLRYLNSTGSWVTLNYVNDSSCSNGNPNWNTTTIESETHKACIKYDGTNYTVRFATPSLSARIYGVEENTAPVLSNIEEPTDPSTYSEGNYKFNATVTDEQLISDIDTVIFEFNSINYTSPSCEVINTTSEECMFTIGSQTVGTYNYLFYANDTANAWTNSSTYTFTINKGSPPLILVNNISWSGTYPFPSNTTGNGCPSALTCNLYRNDSSVSNSNLVLLGVGIYNYTYNTSGNENYSANSTSNILTILQNLTNPTHLITTLTDFAVNYTDTNISFWVGDADFFGYLTYPSSGTASLYVDEINVTNPYGKVFEVGTYLIKVNTSGNENYSANSTGSVQSITVSERTGGDGGPSYPSGGPFGSPLSTYTNVTNETTPINISTNHTPINNTITIINYPTRLAQVTGYAISGKPFDAFLYLIESLGDYFYRWGNAHILESILFRHITFVIIFAVVLDLVIRYSKILKKSKGFVKFLIYFIIVPFITTFISLMLPSV